MTMKTLQFKTNIKCGGCVAAVKPFLDAAEGIESWEVDLQNPDRTPTVQTEQPAEAVRAVVNQAGYTAEPVS